MFARDGRGSLRARGFAEGGLRSFRRLAGRAVRAAHATGVAEEPAEVMPLRDVRRMFFSGSSGFSCSAVSAWAQLALVVALFARPARANRTMIRGAIRGACRASAGRRSRPYGSSARCDAESRCSDFGRTDRILAPRSFRRASRWRSSGPHPRPSTTR